MSKETNRTEPEKSTSCGPVWPAQGHQNANGELGRPFGPWTLYIDTHGLIHMVDDEGFNPAGLVPVWAHRHYPLAASMRVLCCKRTWDDSGWIINRASGFVPGDARTIESVTRYISDVYERQDRIFRRLSQPRNS